MEMRCYFKDCIEYVLYILFVWVINEIFEICLMLISMIFGKF